MSGADRELVAAGLILRRNTLRGPVWLLLRSSKHGEWGFPKGHSDPGETLVQTALRETVEETGIALVAIDGPAFELHYVLPNGRQKRTVYFPATTATSAIVLSHEHDTGAWFNASGVLARLPFPKLKAAFNATKKVLIANVAAANEAVVKAAGKTQKPKRRAKTPVKAGRGKTGRPAVKPGRPVKKQARPGAKPAQPPRKSARKPVRPSRARER